MEDVNHFPLVIIGSGPGGLAASVTASSYGVRNLIVDEAESPGGQVYRAVPSGFEPAGKPALKKEQQEREILVAAAAGAGHTVQWQDGLFWGVDENRSLLIIRDGKIINIGFDALIIASGAYDRSLPFPGWTLPGVLSVGGAYRLVKTQGVLPGRRVLVAGSGPLLLVLVEALLKAGAKVVAIVESSKSSVSLKHLFPLLQAPSLCLEAIRLKAVLRKHRVPLYRGWGILEARGRETVEEIVCAPLTAEGKPNRSAAERFPSDAVAIGYGLLSRTTAARLVGAQMIYDPLVKDYVPLRNKDLETSIRNVFAVGDGARVAGKRVALEEGRLAAMAAAKRLGKISRSGFSRRSAAVRGKLKRLYRFREAVDEIYRLPEGLFDFPADHTIVCRCEEITAGEIRRAAREGTLNLNDIKRRVRAGSGWCQGRTCGPAIVEMLARECKKTPEAVYRMTQRPPAKPIPLSMLIDA